MHFDTDGVYTLLYTAEDECGNTTTEEREVLVASPRTVLYTDGTFIINEQPRDMARNIALHGAATNVYDPFDPNGSTDIQKYRFSSASERPWNSDSRSVKAVEIGSPITPTSMAYWFSVFYNVKTCDLSNIDGSANTSLRRTFEQNNALNSITFGSSWSTNECRTMEGAFISCSALETIDTVSSIVCTENVTNLYLTFNNCNFATLDLSTWDTRNVSNTREMFMGCSNLATIYASPLFTTSSITLSTNMFISCDHLVGGAGTPYSRYSVDKTRAKIDGGTADPGYFTAKS